MPCRRCERLKSVHVVAGVIIDRQSRVLIAQRPKGKPLAGAWEFPGGKLEPGEAPRAALERELAEELGLRIQDPRPLVRLTHTYDHAEVLLEVFVVRRYHGRIQAREDQALKWVRRTELHTEPLLPADRPIPKLLRLPERLRRATSRDYRVLRAAAAAAASPERVRSGEAASGEAEGEIEGPLLGVLCRSPAEARAVAEGRAVLQGLALEAPAVLGTARGIDFFVLGAHGTDEELATLCATLPAPLYVPGRSLERAWSLGASGVHSIV